MPGTFDAKSRAELATCDPRLVMVMEKALLLCPFPFFITKGGGARTIQQQQKFFDAGKSKVNPSAYIGNLPALYRAAKHVVGNGAPLSRACDINVAGQPGGSYDRGALCYVAGLVRAIAHEVGLPIRWGGDFNENGLIAEANTFVDMPHFEIDA